jgi:hypothetical protein
LSRRSSTDSWTSWKSICKQAGAIDADRDED